jgi:hypothetical protein
MLPVVWLCGCAGGVRGSVAAAELTDADAPFVADGLLKAALAPSPHRLSPHVVRRTLSAARCPSVESAQGSARLRLRLRLRLATLRGRADRPRLRCTVPTAPDRMPTAHWPCALGLRAPTRRWLCCAALILPTGRRPPALQAATDATICANGDASVALVVRAAYAAADALALRAGCHQALWPTPGSPAAAFAAACSRTAHALLPPS